MPTIKECRKVMGKEAETLSDDDIEDIRDILSACAEILIDKVDLFI